MVKFFENMSFKNNVYMFLGVIFSTTIIVLVVFGFYMVSLKNAMDYVYNNNIKQTIKLENVKNLYLKSVNYPINKYNIEQISSIKNDIKNIQKEWEEYLEISQKYKNQTFMQNLKISPFLDKKIFQSFIYEKNSEQSITQMISTIKKKLENIEDEKQLQGYLKYLEIQLNTLLKQNTDSITKLVDIINFRYEKNFEIVTTFILIVIFISLLFLYLIIKNAKLTKIRLEDSIKEKTEELRLLNQNLQETLAKELDISRQKDKTILAQARMASLSEMLENVAHQWRQPLGSISMIIQSFETKALKGKLSNEFIESQVKEGLFLTNSMSKTLSDFQNFFSPNKAKETFSLNKAINSALKITKIGLNKKNISVEFNQDRDFAIYCYKNELIQIIINIINNAKDAINENNKYKFIIIQAYEENNMTIIDITDNGGGIDDEIIDKIFDPYFTTKHKSAGTGIGLYMSKNIVEKHIKGELSIKNVIISKFDKDFVCAKFSIKIPMRDLISKI